MSVVFLLSGPILWGCGTVILGDQPDLLIRFVQSPDLHGIETTEALIGLLAAAAGVLISFGAGMAVLLALIQEIARRRGAWGIEQLLAPFSPGFLRRSTALALGAGLALSVSAADSWPRTTPTETVSTLEAGTADEDPDSILFDTTAPHEAPPPEPARERLDRPPHRQGWEPEQVVVRLGDSLWEITADHLGPDATDWEIAASWPAWYELNRDRIGPDPGIILPGTILDTPIT